VKVCGELQKVARMEKMVVCSRWRSARVAVGAVAVVAAGEDGGAKKTEARWW